MHIIKEKDKLVAITEQIVYVSVGAFGKLIRVEKHDATHVYNEWDDFLYDLINYNIEEVEEISPMMMREWCYKTMTTKADDSPLIEFGGQILTCDKAKDLIETYTLEDKLTGATKAQELGTKWLEAREYIRGIHPDTTA